MEEEIDYHLDENGNPFCEFCKTYHNLDNPCPENWY